MALLTTTAGWFPKPVDLLRARWRFGEGQIDMSELRAAEELATREVLRLQEALGLDLVADGQMDRGDPVASFAEGLEGCEPAGLVRCYGNRYCRKVRITEAVSRPGPILVERWTANAGLTSKPLKAIVPGPYTLMDWSFDEHYASREEACMALAEIVRAEVEDLRAAGAREIQIDDPAISARPEEMALAARALSVVTAPLAGEVRVWAHLCHGDLQPVLEAVLALPVDGLLLDLSHAGDELLTALDGLPADKLLGAGVIDVHSAAIEDPATIRGRIERVLRHVPAERLWILPDAGLRSLTQEQVEGKLRAMVTAAA